MRTYTLLNFPAPPRSLLDVSNYTHLFREFDTCDSLTPYFEKMNSFYFVNSTIMNSMINVGFVITTKYNHIKIQ